MKPYAGLVVQMFILYQQGTHIKLRLQSPAFSGTLSSESQIRRTYNLEFQSLWCNDLESAKYSNDYTGQIHRCSAVIFTTFAETCATREQESPFTTDTFEQWSIFSYSLYVLIRDHAIMDMPKPFFFDYLQHHTLPTVHKVPNHHVWALIFFARGNWKIATMNHWKW